MIGLCKMRKVELLTFTVDNLSAELGGLHSHQRRQWLDPQIYRAQLDNVAGKM